jgi:hypothetical protein
MERESLSTIPDLRISTDLPVLLIILLWVARPMTGSRSFSWRGDLAWRLSKLRPATQQLQALRTSPSTTSEFPLETPSAKRVEVSLLYSGTIVSYSLSRYKMINQHSI